MLISLPVVAHAGVSGSCCNHAGNLQLPLFIFTYSSTIPPECAPCGLPFLSSASPFSLYIQLWQQSLGAIPTITRLQEKAETLRQEELNKASSKLSALSDRDLQVVDKVTRGIVAKLIHGPMHHLRQQTEGDATRAAILQVQQAFQLDA